MDYSALATLIQTHPQWPSVDDDTLAAWCNEEVISRDKTTVSSGEIFACCLNNLSEWAALSAADKEIVKDVLYIHSGEGVPTAVGEPARTVLIAKLGTLTKQCIAAKISDLVSRADAAGIPGKIRAGDVGYARTV